jgi:ABC-type uncharacterized transport system involved in gliding motility auxiliary subunit
MDKKAKVATQSGIFVVLMLCILVGANVISFRVHKRIDLTTNQRYTLSKGSGSLVSGLKKPLTIKAYVTVGLPKLDAFVRDLDDLMLEYERAAGKNEAGQPRFIYEKHIAKTEEEKTQAKDYGLMEAAFGEGSQTESDSATIAKGYLGIVFLYGDEQDKIPILTPDNNNGLEFWLSNKIREIRDKAEDNKRKIGVLTGKDEIKLSDSNLVANQGGRPGPSMQSIIQQNFPFYDIRPVDLKDGESAIDAELDGLVITQPGKDFNDKELRRIDEFVMRGNKGLVIYASAVNMKASDAKFSTKLNTHGLEKLMGGYGIEMKKDVVLDWQRSVMFAIPNQSGGQFYIRDPALAHVENDPGANADEQTLDNGFPAFFRLPSLSFPFPSSLELKKDKQPTAKFTIAARTSNAAWSETDESIDLGLKPNWKPKQPLAQKNIAIAVEGKIKSAFGGGDKDGIKLPAETPKDSRILVVSSSQFLANPFARQGNGQQMQGQMAMMMPSVGGDKDLQYISGPYAQKWLTTTILSFKNTLDWLTGDNELLAASAKVLGEPNLTYTGLKKPKLDPNATPEQIKAQDEEMRKQRKEVQSKVQFLLILFMPLMFALYGIFRWQMRERGRANIAV